MRLLRFRLRISLRLLHLGLGIRLHLLQLILQLLDLEQHSVAETSEVTGWNRSLVKVRAFRARGKLKKLFGELERKERR